MIIFLVFYAVIFKDFSQQLVSTIKVPFPVEYHLYLFNLLLSVVKYRFFLE